MKIIGLTNDGFVVDMRGVEMANLIGHYSEYSDGYPFKHGRPAVGTEVKINDLYQQLRKVEEARSQLTKAQKDLHELANKLGPVSALVPLVIIPKD